MQMDHYEFKNGNRICEDNRDREKDSVVVTKLYKP